LRSVRDNNKNLSEKVTSPTRQIKASVPINTPIRCVTSVTD